MRLFDTLVRLDRETLQPVPELAKSIEVSEDGLLYTLRLDPEARFHNGRPVSATDVKASWERAAAPSTLSDYAWLFEPIKGAEAFRAGEADANLYRFSA